MPVELDADARRLRITVRNGMVYAGSASLGGLRALQVVGKGRALAIDGAAALPRLAASLARHVKDAVAGEYFGKPQEPAQAISELADYVANADDPDAVILAACRHVAALHHLDPVTWEG